MKNQVIKSQKSEEEIIYQYYSLSTFNSIIRNKELWFSDIKKMNDKNEDTEIFLFLKKELRKIMIKIEEEEKKYKENAIKKELIDKITKIAKEDKYKDCLREIKKISVRKDPKYLLDLKEKRNKIAGILSLRQFQEADKFISCFSKKGDLLGQWRSYADDGKGICIGFKLEELKRIFSKLSTIEGSINNISYLNENMSVEAILKKFNEENIFSSVLEESFAPILEDINDEFERDFFISMLGSDFFKIVTEKYLSDKEKEMLRKIKEICKKYNTSTFFKHSGFEEEKEVRILIKKIKESEEKEKTRISKNDFRINQKNDDFIEYIKLIFSEEDFKSIVSEIVIGPNNNIDEIYLKKFLENQKILKKNEQTIEIKKSKIPYKN